MDMRHMLVTLGLVVPWVLAATLFVVGFWFGEHYALTRGGVSPNAPAVETFDGIQYFEDLTAVQDGLARALGTSAPGTTSRLLGHRRLSDGSVRASFLWEDGASTGRGHATLVPAR